MDSQILSLVAALIVYFASLLIAAGAIMKISDFDQVENPSPGQNRAFLEGIKNDLYYVVCFAIFSILAMIVPVMRLYIQIKYVQP